MSTNNEESLLQEIRQNSRSPLDNQSVLEKSKEKADIDYNTQESVKHQCLAKYHKASTLIKIFLPPFFYLFIIGEIIWIIYFISSNPDKFDSQSLAIIIGSIIIQPFLIARIITNALYFSDNSLESKKTSENKDTILKKLKDFIAQLENKSNG